MKVLGITNAGPVACSGEDTSSYGSSPDDPSWRSYSAAYAGPGVIPPQPYTSGAFETWARPIIVRTFELWMNCKKVPPDNTALSFFSGLIGAWNARYPNAAMRTIPYAQAICVKDPRYQLESPFWQQCIAWSSDPVQKMLSAMANEKQVSDISIQVADPPAGAIPASRSVITLHLQGQRVGATSAGPTATQVVAGTAAVGGAALLGTAIYSAVTGIAIGAVVEHAWKHLKGWFRS
jgi:hypothetical protein